jgi:3-keto-5-aminohexanoate cleavage enzyme
MEANKLSYKIRYAQKDDVPAILKVLENYNMHHVPSPEMPDLDYRFFYVALVDEKVVGACGYKLLSPETGKTTLLGVEPAYSRLGIGMTLQAKRMAAMKSLGCEKLITNADRPETIRWYQKHFGYRPVGTIQKEHSFGLDEVDHWTTLETDLRAFDPKKFLPEVNMPPLIINAVLTGAIHNKDSNPHLPVTPDEIVEDAFRTVDAGASIIHIHARDTKGENTLDPSIYSEIIVRIRRKRPDPIICVSTTGRMGGSAEQRASALLLDGDAKPDMASLTLGSMNFHREVNINPPETIRYLAEVMQERGIKPETESFDLGMLDYARHLVHKGFLQLPIYNNSILGAGSTMAARESNAAILKKSLPVDTIWAVTGLGRYQKRITEWAVNNGAHVRIGLEDNLYLDQDSKTPASNLELVEYARDLAESVGRPIATPREAREMIGL